jgi:LytS/YehU family sensor histidine kinase
VEGLGARVLADMAATERRAAAETALAQGELEVLKAQLKPHFLFNALNGIAALAHEQAREAAPMLGKLAELYRLILAAGRQAMQPLSVELTIVRDYLDLEKLRLGKRLDFAVKVDGARDKTPVPGLLLQTLVENAVKHGVAPCLEGGRIDVHVKGADGGDLAVEIRNTGQPLAAEYKPSTGLTTTVRRLDLLAPGRHGFSLTRAPDGATVVSFTLPGGAS